MKEGLIQELKTQEKFFMNTISCLTEEDSGFKPTEETYKMLDTRQKQSTGSLTAYSAIKVLTWTLKIMQNI